MHDPAPSSSAVAASLSLGLAASFALWLTPPSSAADTLGDPPYDVAALRARGPGALEALLSRYDREASPSGRAALEAAIDAVAGQRYATVSRLYWYTDLALAEIAAHQLHRPIL